MLNQVVLDTTIWGYPIVVRLFGLLALVVSAGIYPLYITSMVKGRQTPPRSSWFLWFILDGFAFTSSLAAGTFDALLFIYTVGTIIVSAFTIKYGKKGWTKFETYCTAIVACTVLVWLKFGPAVAVVSSMVGVTVAFLPLLKGVLKGEYEDLFAWSLAIVGSGLNLADGQLLVSVWFMILQVVVVVAVTYHHIYLPQKRHVDERSTAL